MFCTIRHLVFARFFPKFLPLKKDMIFDVASLTKPIVTVSLLMKLVESGKVDVDQRLSRIFQSFALSGKEEMTIRHLLTHSSGYSSWIPFYKEIEKLDAGERSGIMNSRGAVEFVYSKILRSELKKTPGLSAEYSDVGFILLGHAIEVLSGVEDLGRLARDEIFQPLGLRESGFIDLREIKRGAVRATSDNIVPTARCLWRDKILLAEVHDDNAWAMGGVAAHAGLFCSAMDVHKFAREMICCFLGKGQLFKAETVRQFWTRDCGVADSAWALGWDTPSEKGSSAGKYFSKQAVGHLGYTGVSLWIEPERELDVVLLSNRVHPSTKNKRIKEFRPELHDLVMEALGYSVS